MTKIRPFKAVLYNQEKNKDLSRLVCPPYDVISQSRQEYYHNLDPHNLIHILLGRDTPGEDKYERAAKFFNDWLKNKILIQDDKPAIYFYSQEYKIRGEKKARYGFISLLHLETQKSSLFAHEHTRIAPKEDRIKIIRQVKANLSPIFVVFADQKRMIKRTCDHSIKNEKPFIDITDDEGVSHKLWKLTDPAVLTEIGNQMQRENLFIADGHHRYEVACMYRDELCKAQTSFTGEEPFNYIMAYFTNTDSRGLTIFPIHRLVKTPASFDLDSFKSKVKDYFDIEEVKDKARLFFLMEKAGHIEHVLGMCKDKRYWLLRLKNVKILDKEISDKPAEYRMLDVSVLNYIILKKILGMDLQAQNDDIQFIHDTDELLRRVDEDASYMAFVLNPVRIQQIMSVALKGERMPPKSTYFYPKVLSGLVVNKF